MRRHRNVALTLLLLCGAAGSLTWNHITVRREAVYTVDAAYARYGLRRVVDYGLQPSLHRELSVQGYLSYFDGLLIDPSSSPHTTITLSAFPHSSIWPVVLLSDEPGSRAAMNRHFILRVRAPSPSFLERAWDDFLVYALRRPPPPGRVVMPARGVYRIVLDPQACPPDWWHPSTDCVDGALLAP